MDNGALLLDTPGMRALEPSACENGIDETFLYISKLATQCRFADYSHQHEPKYTVQEALEAGTLEQIRLTNYFKLFNRHKYRVTDSAKSNDKIISKVYQYDAKAI